MPFLVPFIPAIATAVVGGAVALNGQSQAKKSADAALAANQQATDRSLAAQEAARNQIAQLQSPVINSRDYALRQLAGQYGLGGPASGSVANAYGGQPSAPVGQVTTGGGGKAGGGTIYEPQSVGPAQGGGPDWNAYIQANPDVAAWIQQGHGDPNLGPNQTPAQAAAYQFQNTGQGEGRAAPPMLAGATPDPAGQAPPTAPADLGTASPVVPTYNTPDFGSSPDAASYLDPSKFTTSPGYQFRLNEGLRNTNASFGAKGLLQSGAALKGFNDYAQNSASDEYGKWFAQQQQLYQDKANQYNTDKTTNYNIFSTDRGYGTNLALNNRDFANTQQNNRISNLFSLVNAGTGAAASIGGADAAYANNASNLYGNNAAARGDAANANGAANAQLGGALGGIATGLINNYSGGYGGTPMNVQQYQNPLATAPGQIPYTGSVSYNPITY